MLWKLPVEETKRSVTDVTVSSESAKRNWKSTMNGHEREQHQTASHSGRGMEVFGASGDFHRGWS